MSYTEESLFDLSYDLESIARASSNQLDIEPFESSPVVSSISKKVTKPAYFEVEGKTLISDSKTCVKGAADLLSYSIQAKWTQLPVDTSKAKYDTFLNQTGLTRAFALIFEEIMTHNVDSEQVFKYTALRLRRIGKDLQLIINGKT